MLKLNKNITLLFVKAFVKNINTDHVVFRIIRLSITNIHYINKNIIKQTENNRKRTVNSSEILSHLN